jgi:hydroxymethylbilane synthase
VGQGALAVQCRQDDVELRIRLLRLHDRLTGAATTAERAFLRRVQGSCKTPLGAHATVADGRLRLQGFIGHPDGRLVRGQAEGPLEGGEELGSALADRLLGEGGRALLAEESRGQG